MFFGKKSAAKKRTIGVADEAVRHRENHWAPKLRAIPFGRRMTIIYLGTFVVGFAVETFACKTGLYAAVTHKKTERRHELDEIVLEFRQNMEKWTAEDIRIAQMKEQAAEQHRLSLLQQQEPKSMGK